MLELSAKTNLLEENDYRYSLQDVKDPVLYRDVYNYDEVPKVAFNHRRVPMSMPADIWITDTSFRDGQQSMNPYTPEQIEHLFKLLSKLGGPYGLIRQTEFSFTASGTGRPSNAVRLWGCASRRSLPGSGPPGRTSGW